MSTIQELLPFTELNTDKTQTIVLIHGLGGTGQSWQAIAEHLQDYHLILPDLPEHGEAKQSSALCTPDLAAAMIAEVIRRHAKGSRARIVGFSLGGHVAVSLIAQHPSVVDDAVITGYNVFEKASTALIARAYWTENRITVLAASFSSSEEQKPTTLSWELCQRVAAMTTTEAWPVLFAARTLFIAAGKNAPMTNIRDRAQNAIRLRELGRSKNELTRAVTNPTIPHPWPITHPELFAQTVLAWFEDKPLPQGFVDL